MPAPLQIALQRDGLDVFNLAFAERMVRRAKFTQRDQHHDRPGAARAKIYGMHTLRDMYGGVRCAAYDKFTMEREKEDVKRRGIDAANAALAAGNPSSSSSASSSSSVPFAKAKAKANGKDEDG